MPYIYFSGTSGVTGDVKFLKAVYVLYIFENLYIFFSWFNYATAIIPLMLTTNFKILKSKAFDFKSEPRCLYQKYFQRTRVSYTVRSHVR